MLIDEIIERINFKQLDKNCNHNIYIGLNDKELQAVINGIHSKSIIMNYEKANLAFSYHKRIKSIYNVVIDIEHFDVRLLFMEITKKINIECNLLFVERDSIKKLIEILRKYEKCIQIIFYQNKNSLSDKQKLLNELLWYRSYFISITYLLTQDFSIYQTLQGDILKENDNYQKFYISKQ